MHKHTRTVFVDCTETISTCINTGIQRNVNNIICRSDQISNYYRVNIIPVISVSGKLFKYNINSEKKYISLLSSTFAYLRNLLDRILNKKYDINQIIYNNIDTEISNSFHSKIVEICRLIMPLIFIMAYRLDGSFQDTQPIETKKNDIILFADTFWNTDTCNSILLYKNVFKFVLIYDVIPVTYPELCDDITVYLYNKKIRQIIPHINGIITISKSEKNSIQKHLNKLNSNIDTPVEYYHLGADFMLIQQVLSSVRDIVRKAMCSKNVFLMVGTIEPRKNHAYVLDAFEELWRRGETTSLCIVGKVGWKCTNLLERITTHSRFGESLFYFHNLIDEELAFCYEKCAAVVFASIAEGFGLPLVEAMSYGRSILVSDIQVFREIGEDYPIYFPLNDLGALVQCLYDFTHGAFKRPQPKTWISWDESVLNLFGKVLRMASESEQRLVAS